MLYLHDGQNVFNELTAFIKREWRADEAAEALAARGHEVLLVAIENAGGFKGGYCGASACTSNAGCPDGSICVTQSGANYCFRTCEDKTECNANRSEANESNCSSSITRVEAGNQKACVPPSSGT